MGDWDTNTDLTAYLRDIGKYDLITVERERELAQIIQHGKSNVRRKIALDELVLANLRIVINIATKMYNGVYNFDDVNLSLLDLIQFGNMGLIRAAELFNPLKEETKDVKFITYAYKTIERKIRIELKSARIIRLPVNYFTYIATISKLEQEFGKDVSDEIIKKELNITQELLNVVKQNRYPTVSVDKLEEEYARMTDGKVPVIEAINSSERKEWLISKLNELDAKDRDVLYYRFLCGDGLTLEQIGAKWNLTKERIRQMIPVALRRLRKKIEVSESRYRMGLNKKGVKTNGTTNRKTNRRRGQSGYKPRSITKREPIIHSTSPKDGGGVQLTDLFD